MLHFVFLGRHFGGQVFWVIIYLKVQLLYCLKIFSNYYQAQYGQYFYQKYPSRDYFWFTLSFNPFPSAADAYGGDSL